MGGAGDAALKEQLEECLNEEDEAQADKTRLNLTNENVEDDDDDGVRFDSIVFLGRHPIADPKNESSIHNQIQEHNVLHDLGEDEGQYQTVKVQVSDRTSLQLHSFHGFSWRKCISIRIQSFLFDAHFLPCWIPTFCDS